VAQPAALEHGAAPTLPMIPKTNLAGKRSMASVGVRASAGIIGKKFTKKNLARPPLIAGTIPLLQLNFIESLRR